MSFWTSTETYHRNNTSGEGSIEQASDNCSKTNSIEALSSRVIILIFSYRDWTILRLEKSIYSLFIKRLLSHAPFSLEMGENNL